MIISDSPEIALSSQGASLDFLENLDLPEGLLWKFFLRNGYIFSNVRFLSRSLFLLRTYLKWRKVRDTFVTNFSFVTILSVTILEEIVTI